MQTFQYDEEHFLHTYINLNTLSNLIGCMESLQTLSSLYTFINFKKILLLKLKKIYYLLIFQKKVQNQRVIFSLGFNAKKKMCNLTW